MERFLRGARALANAKTGARAAARAPAPVELLQLEEAARVTEIARRRAEGMNLLRSVSATVLLMLVARACMPSGQEPGQPPTMRQPPPSAGPLVLSLQAPAQARTGEPVFLRLVLENPTDQPVEVELGGDPVAFDLRVLASDSSEIWRRLDRVPVEDILTSRTVPPRDSIAFTDSWDQRRNDGSPAPAGVYAVEGLLPLVETFGGWPTERRALTILP